MKSSEETGCLGREGTRLQPGVTNHVQVQLIPAPRITGTVRDPSGKPAAGVTVSFNPGYYFGASLPTETRTDKDGHVTDPATGTLPGPL